MSSREMKSVIRRLIESEDQLVGFCIECLEYIFKDSTSKNLYVAEFKEDVDTWLEYNGYLQCLSRYLEDEKRRKERLNGENHE